MALSKAGEISSIAPFVTSLLSAYASPTRVLVQNGTPRVLKCGKGPGEIRLSDRGTEAVDKLLEVCPGPTHLFAANGMPLQNDSELLEAVKRDPCVRVTVTPQAPPSPDTLYLGGKIDQLGGKIDQLVEEMRADRKRRWW